MITAEGGRTVCGTIKRGAALGGSTGATGAELTAGAADLLTGGAGLAGTADGGATV